MPAPKGTDWQYYDLDLLRDAAKKACIAACEKCTEIPGPINWRNLGCYEASRYENEKGEIGYFVRIEEASPSASDLMFFISRELKNSGFDNIEVKLEW